MTKYQYNILKRLEKGEKIDDRYCTGEEEQVCIFLTDCGFSKRICPEPNDEGCMPCVYVITEAGKQEIHTISELNKSDVINNVKYFITTAIALAAFIKSFFFI